MARLLLIRHGETEWNAKGLYQGISDIPLNDLGIRQATELAESLSDHPLKAIYSSDLTRAVKTAEIINEHHNLPLEHFPTLREGNLGELEGKPYNSELFNKTYKEEREQIVNRTLKTLLELGSRHKGETIAVVCHGGVIGSLLIHCTGARRAIHNCEVVPFLVEEGTLVHHP